MQVTIDEKTLTLIVGALVSLGTALWYVSRAYSRLDKIEKIERRQDEHDKELRQQHDIVHTTSSRVEQIWKFLGFSEQRLTRQRVVTGGFVRTEEVVELVPPKSPPPPQPPKWASLVGPNDPHLPSPIPPPEISALPTPPTPQDEKPPHPTTTRIRTWPGRPLPREDPKTIAPPPLPPRPRPGTRR